MQDLRKAAVVIGSHGEELQGGKGGLGCGTAWRLREYKGANEAKILPSIPRTHHTHLQGHKREESTGETQQILLGTGKMSHWGWIHSKVEGILIHSLEDREISCNN